MEQSALNLKCLTDLKWLLRLDILNWYLLNYFLIITLDLDLVKLFLSLVVVMLPGYLIG